VPQTQQVPEIDTAAALAITRANHRIWRQAMDKQHYVCAPPATGIKRAWALADLITLRWFDSLCLTGMPGRLAGSLAGELAKALRDPVLSQAEVLYAFAWADEDGERGHLAIGTEPPAHAPRASVIADLPVRRWRGEMEAAIEDYRSRQARRDAKRRR
jgi:hypothetical protein